MLIPKLVFAQVSANTAIPDLIEDSIGASGDFFITHDISTDYSRKMTISNVLGVATDLDDGGIITAVNSAEWLTRVTDETGTGVWVFSISPALVTPALGTPTALVGTNITGTAAGLTAGLATAAAADGTDCGVGEYARGVDVSWNGELCTDATTEIDSAILTHTGIAAAHQALVTLNASATTGGMSLSGQEISNRAATNAQTGYATAAHITAIEANTSKDTNVSTNLSEGTSTETTVDVDSSDGTNATLVAASTIRAGILTKAKFDEVVANTAKTTNATHTGDVTGATALTIGADKVNDTHIDFGVGANQVSAVDVPIADAGTKITATEVEGALQENRTAIDLNTAKTTNATHTGEVTGATALTVADNIIDEANLKLDEAPTNDFVLTADSAKSGGMKWLAFASGFSDPMTTRGDIIYKNATITTRLPVGTADQVLTADGTDIAWATLPTMPTGDIVGTTDTQTLTNKTIDGNNNTITNVGGGEAFPVGSVFISVVATNPGTLLGYGTWAAFAQGRMLIGLNSSDTDFDTVEETGGAKTHSLTTAELASHNHTQNAHTHTQNAHTHTQNSHSHTAKVQWGATDAQNRRPETGAGNYAGTGASDGSVNGTVATNQNTTPTNQNTTPTNNTAGSGTAHSIMNPYIVTYMWKRTV